MSANHKVSILLVDDHPKNLLALEAILANLGENLVKAHSGEEALRRLLHEDFAVILLDVQMPGMNGFETASLIRQRERSKQTPIIFLTAFSTNDELVFKGYALGAVDYLHKPIDPVILTSKVSVFVDLFRKTEMIQKQAEEVKRQAAQLATMNAELRQSEERFRLLNACSPVGIFVTDTEGHCVYANSRCEAICGLTLENNLDDIWLQIIHPDDRQRVLTDWTNYTEEAQEYSSEFRLQRNQPVEQGYRWVHVRSTPMLSDQNELLGYVGTIEDISERKQMEATRHQIIREQVARREAEATSRMKDEFLAVLSHELRTPLNAMLGWSRLLRTRKFDQDTTARALEIIERNATAQAQLIEDILDVSKIIRGKLRLNCTSVSLVSIVEAAIDVVRPQAEAKTIQLNVQLDSNLRRTWGDPVRLQQIVWNLLANAVKFTPEGGQVYVQLEQISGNSAQTAAPMQAQPLQSTPDSAHAQISISDTGIGISADFLPNVFDRFRQADSTTTRSHNGLGLGLAIVRHLVELHGGRVQATSPGENQGSTFTVQLPLQPVPLATNSPGSHLMPALHPHALQNMKVLIVDDEADAREFLTFALQQYGAHVTAVASMQEAIDELNLGLPNALVSDIGMPEQDGYALIHQVRTMELQGQRHLPAVALTAYSSPEDRNQALSAGFDAHVSKPVEIAELVDTLAQLLSDSPLPSSVG